MEVGGVSGAWIGCVAGMDIGPAVGTRGWVRSSCGSRSCGGSYFPEWQLDPRTRSERAFVSGGCGGVCAGFSTRRVEGLVEALGGQIAVQIPGVGGGPGTGPDSVRVPQSGPSMLARYTYVWADALAA